MVHCLLQESSAAVGQHSHSTESLTKGQLPGSLTAKSIQLTSSPRPQRLLTSSQISVAASGATEPQAPVCASRGGDDACFAGSHPNVA